MYIASRKDFWSALVILALVGICWNESHNIDTGINFALGPLFFPYVLMGAIVLCGAALLLRSIGWRRPVPADAAPADTFAVRALMLRRLLLMGATCAYLVILPYAGYTICTLVFLMGTMCALGRRGARHIGIYAVISLAMTFGLYWIFSGLLHLFLP